MRVHGDNPVKVGLWLYRPERKSKRKAGDEWDPSVPVALAFVAPSDRIGERPWEKSSKSALWWPRVAI